MKKVVIGVIGIIILFYILLHASTWPSDVKVALEFLVPNTTNTGNGTWTFTNNGTTAYSSTIPGGGQNSMGIFDSNTKSLTSDASITNVIQTLQFSYEVISTGVPAVAALWYDSAGDLLYYYGLTCYYYDPASGQFGFTVTRDAPHTIRVVWNGTNAVVYYDNAWQGTEVSYQPTSRSHTWGIRNSGEYCNCYEWNILMSTTNYGDTPIATVANTNTPTPNLTQTEAATETQIAQTQTATWV